MKQGCYCYVEVSPCLLGNSLAIQWLGLDALTARAQGLTPVQGLPR